MSSLLSPVFRSSILTGALLLAMASAHAQQEGPWNWTTLSAPNWEVSVTDAGYSDYLMDLTPGFAGREYLSGEWAGAIGYKQSGNVVKPIWLEPNFSYPDYRTNSNFQTLGATELIAPTSPNVLAAARSVIGNDALRVTQRFEVIDTVTGVAMGLTPADAAGAGASMMSNRYALRQTYTFTNVSGSALQDLRFYQFLHGFESQAGVYDNRQYAGALSEYRHDVTLHGVSGASAQDEESLFPPVVGLEAPVGEGGAVQFKDYVGFHSKIAPSAVEIGAFGNMLTDDHTVGKPGQGTHLSVEAGQLNGATSHDGTLNQDWIAGAQQYELGPIAPGQSVDFDVLLTLRTGWLATENTGVVGGFGTSPGSIAYAFEEGLQLPAQGDEALFFASYDQLDLTGVDALLAARGIGALTFDIAGGKLQLFDLKLANATWSGLLRLGFNIDLSLLPQGSDLSKLRVYHWTGEHWEDLGGELSGNTLTVSTDGLSPFAIGMVPEADAVAMFVAGLGLVGLRHLRRKAVQLA